MNYRKLYQELLERTKAQASLIEEQRCKIENYTGAFDRDMDRITRHNKARDHMTAEISRLRGALLAIEEWQHPYPGFSFDHGSNGERNHFRAVARKALGSEM